MIMINNNISREKRWGQDQDQARFKIKEKGRGALKKEKQAKFLPKKIG